LLNKFIEMKYSVRILNECFLGFALITVFSYSAKAQKLNNVQEGSVSAPADVKADGKLKEWTNPLQAYNKTTQLHYTLANDGQNLYLAVQSTDQTNNRKIIAGGISFTINTEGKKKDKGAFLITFPVVSQSAMRGQFRRRGGAGGQQGGLDSAAIVAMRKQIIASAKEITVSGFAAITDSVISIYNEYGIKAAIDYDTKGNLVYELALPLKLLNISVDDPKEFAYNIKVNGIQFGNRGDGGGNEGGGGFGGGGGRRGGGNGGGGGGFGGGGGRSGPDGGDLQSMMSPTDFWGKYLLIKK
jgi:hypothetical protein